MGAILTALTGFISDTFGGIWLYVIGAGVIIGLAWGAYDMVYNSGKANCELAQQTKQLKQDQKVGADYAQIDRNTPYGADQRAAADFLLRNIRHN